MKSTLMLIVAAGTLFLVGCGHVREVIGTVGHSGPTTIGSSKMATETRMVSGFQSVSIPSSGRVTIEQSGKESLIITAEDNILPLLTVEVKDGQLTLGMKPNSNISSTKEFVYKLTVKEINGIDISGSAEVVANGLKSDKLKIDISGSGDLTLSGTAAVQDIRISGSGHVRAEDLKGASARVDISGSGKAILSVSDKLFADISGSGSVEYSGSPVVTKNVSGSGSLEKR